jgi:hypothetical protein
MPLNFLSFTAMAPHSDRLFIKRFPSTEEINKVATFTVSYQLLAFGNRNVLTLDWEGGGAIIYQRLPQRYWTCLWKLWLAFHKKFCTLRSSLVSRLQKTWLMANQRGHESYWQCGIFANTGSNTQKSKTYIGGRAVTQYNILVQFLDFCNRIACKSFQCPGTYMASST